MSHQQQHPSSDRPVGHPGLQPDDHWLQDCWLVEVMPPTWAWAYGKLLNPFEKRTRRGGNRLA